MPVAVHLVEILTLVTFLGVLAAFSVLIITAEGVINGTIAIFSPMAEFCRIVLHCIEKISMWLMQHTLEITSNLGNSFGFGVSKN